MIITSISSENSFGHDKERMYMIKREQGSVRQKK